MSLEGDTIFHKILRKELPADVVYENEQVLAFRDINPAAPQHVLVIPKSKSIESLRSAQREDIDLLGELLFACKCIASKLDLDESGYRVVINSGEGAQQSVFHLHLHIIGGRDLSWPPG